MYPAHHATPLPASLVIPLAICLLGFSPLLAMIEEEAPLRPAAAAPAAAPRDLTRVLVKFREGLTEKEARAAHSRVRGRVTWRSRATRWQAVELSPGEDPRTALRRYRFHPAVESVEIVRPRRLAAVPNDLLPHQWMFRNDGEPMGWCCPGLKCVPCPLNKARFTFQGTAGADVNAVPAWDLATGTRDVVVAVLDTGIDLDRDDLAEHLVPGRDFVNDDNIPDDDNGHGTGVASLIGAVGNNGEGLTGLNWKVSLMPLKVCDSTGACAGDDIIAAIEYAANHGADVINMSLACDEHRDPNTRRCEVSLPGECYSQAEEQAIRYARAFGVVVVEAAGNCGTDNDDATTAYPCAYDLDNNICAGATDMDDHVASFSSYGPQTVEIGAPGALVTTYRNGPNAPYWQPSGTSFASPITAGAAALILSRTPMAPGDVRERIMAGDNRQGEAGAAFAGGRLNVFTALQQVFLPGRFIGPDEPGDVTLLADVTRDGRLDLIRGFTGGGFQVSKFKGKKMVFKEPRVWSEASPTPVVLAADVTGDRRADLILAGPGKGISVHKAKKKKFKDLGSWSPEDPGLVLLAGDVNGDGRDDMVRYDGGFDVLLSTGEGFEPPVPWSGESLRDLAALGDVDGDGLSDLVHWTSLPGRTLVEVSLSSGSGFGAPSIWQDTLGLHFVGLDDFDGDGRDDLAGFDPLSGCIRIMRGLPGTFSQARAWSCPGPPDLLFPGQASRKRKDGRADLVGWTGGIGWELLESAF